jgi:hypothetical protein
MSATDFFIYIGPSLIIGTIVVCTYFVCKMVGFRNVNYEQKNETDISGIELVISDNEEDEVEINGFDNV